MTARQALNESRPNSAEVQKVIRLIEYLTRLASLRSKIIRDIEEYQKALWIQDVPRQKGCFAQPWSGGEEHDPDLWVEVQTRREPGLPSVPVLCKDWVDTSSLKDKRDFPKLWAEITRQDENPGWREGSDQAEIIQRTYRLADHPEVQREWDLYVEGKWLPWSEDHTDWEAVHKVYSTLFAIHQEQARLGEEYELVLGLGLLTWQTPAGQRVRRHLLVGDALLEFEARLGKFTVRPHPEGTRLRLELDMLDVEDQPKHAQEAVKDLLADAEDDPWKKPCMESVLQALVHSISPQGEYEDSLEAKQVSTTTKPIVEYAPALILRKRSARGITEMLRRIKERIGEKGEIPGELRDLAEIGPQREFNPEESAPPETSGEPAGEVFFPKPSNEEQRRIVDKIRAAGGVLVQGPPGTGKSHTIANLICHLLATGQRTLITAKTPRALQVLEGLLPEELRPLCINLLGGGLDERRSLESSVNGILRKHELWNEGRAQRRREELEGDLRQLREEKVKIDRQLREIRESETYSHAIAEGTYRGTAARIAEAVDRDRSAYEWFTDAAALDQACPARESDLLDVLAGLRHFTPEKRRELDLEWPHNLPTPGELTELFEAETRATEEEGRLASGVDGQIAELLATREANTINALREALVTFQDLRKRLLAVPRSWLVDAMRDAMSSHASLWRERLRATQESIASIDAIAKVADDASVKFQETEDPKALYESACTLKEHLRNGGRLGFWVFRPKVVRERIHLVKSVSVHGRRCSTVDDFSRLADVSHVRLECERAWSYWMDTSERIQGPYTLQLHALKELCGVLAETLLLEGLLDRCREAIRQCQAVNEPTWSNGHEIDTWIASCYLALARQKKALAEDGILRLERALSSLATKNQAHPITSDLLRAVRERNLDDYARAVEVLSGLGASRQSLRELDERVSTLGRDLPRLTDELRRACSERCWDERLQGIRGAWHWAQAKYWAEAYTRQEDVPALTKRAKQIEDEINATIAKLASLHAWSFCFSRLQEEHRRHMEAWQQSMRRLGKGTGKHAARHRREAQRHLNKCREAVPAWVMPLHRVWDTVDPAPGMFDVVVVDEASQCGVEALTLLYLGKKILIVGDDKQISPDAVGLSRETVHRLMDEFLHDFKFKSSFDVESSLFDHGKLRYGTRRITLREHFRCMPEIIRFSNDLCYSDTPLIPLRQYGPDRLPPLERVFVEEGYREGSYNRVINKPEADAIACKIAELCADKRYNKKTMGVVVLQGEAQAGLIEGRLLELLGAEEMERRRLICGNPYSFQGDERDIIFLSLVAASNERIGPLTKAADERRFNVAASRARDQMYLFHSVRAGDLSEKCLRRHLLSHFEGAEPREIAGINREELERRAFRENRSIVRPPAPFESWFEVDVALEVARRGFDVVPQYEVAGKRIDLVVEGGAARLAIECDGDKWHGLDRYEEDMQRQRQLERCQWEFVHIRESVFYANREPELGALWRALEERGIVPRGMRSDDESGQDEDERDDGEEYDAEGEDSLEEEILLEDDFGDSEDRSVRRSVDDISTSEVQEAFLRALSTCPNQSCTLSSATARVLKELGVRTRGNPRSEFEKRVLRRIDALERKGIVEKYKAKNRRVRLLREELS